MSKIIQKRAKVLSNIHLTGNYYKLALDLSEIARFARPGQFVMLRVSSGYLPLLRRPFSIHRVVYRKNAEAIGIEILYKVIGKGTKILSLKKPGEYLDALGPLGNGFSLSAILQQTQDTSSKDTEHGRSVRHPMSAILVAGGMGVAPLLFLAQRLIGSKALVIIGAKTKKEILSQKEFANLGLSVKISTDDGSTGFKGKATGLLRSILRKSQNVKRTMAFACGPKPMLSEIAIISKHYNIPAQISLDEYMACGLGVCLGCVVETKEGQRFVCRDGPVFDVSKINWYNK